MVKILGSIWLTISNGFDQTRTKKQKIEYWSIEGKNYIVRNWPNFSKKQEKTIDYWPSEGSNYIDTIHVSCNNILIGWKPRAEG